MGEKNSSQEYCLTFKLKIVSVLILLMVNSLWHYLKVLIMVPVFECFHTHCLHTPNLELSYCCIQFLLGEGTVMVDITKKAISFST